jgi:hypothetical protein
MNKLRSGRIVRVSAICRPRYFQNTSLNLIGALLGSQDVPPRLLAVRTTPSRRKPELGNSVLERFAHSLKFAAKYRQTTAALQLILLTISLNTRPRCS